MIKLEVEEYCANCPDFEPYVSRDEINHYSIAWGEMCRRDTLVTCEYADRCRCIKKYIEDSRMCNRDA